MDCQQTGCRGPSCSCAGLGRGCFCRTRAPADLPVGAFAAKNLGVASEGPKRRGGLCRPRVLYAWTASSRAAVCRSLTRKKPEQLMSFQPDSSLTRGFIVPKARTRQADGDLLHPYSIGVGFLPRGVGGRASAGVELASGVSGVAGGGLLGGARGLRGYVLTSTYGGEGARAVRVSRVGGAGVSRRGCFVAGWLRGFECGRRVARGWSSGGGVFVERFPHEGSKSGRRGAEVFLSRGPPKLAPQRRSDSGTHRATKTPPRRVSFSRFAPLPMGARSQGFEAACRSESGRHRATETPARCGSFSCFAPLPMGARCRGFEAACRSESGRHRATETPARCGSFSCFAPFRWSSLSGV
jgi:hypothetical protein